MTGSGSRSRRDLFRRFANLEAGSEDTDNPRELGWFDVLEYVERSDPDECREEYFGEPVTVPDTEWSRRLRAASKRASDGVVD